MPDIILEMRQITKEFSGVKALDEVNFSVRRGEIHAICGENGAGKSTLMNVLSGTYPCGSYSGGIIFEGEECRFHGIKDSEKKGIVIVHQELALSPYLSIAENIFLGNEQTQTKGVIDWDLTRINAEKILQVVGLENENLDLPVNRLGVGKQQLIEIAKSLAKKAKLLILDEPTAALNDQESDRLLNLLVSLKQNGMTIILISHKLHELEKISDSITILRDGRTIETIDRTNQAYNENSIIKSMVGRTITNRFPERDHSSVGEVVIEVQDWNVDHPDYENKRVIKNANFYARRGEVVGIAGLMGAGRTELAMSIFGHAYGKYIKGAIRKNGQALKLNDIDEALRHGIVYLTEDRKNFGLVLINDVKWNMSLAVLRQLSNLGVVDEISEIKVAEEYTRKMNIKVNSIDQRVSSLSGGNQQKVVLSKWVLTKPDVLILDEPTRGIDVGAKYELYLIINELVAEGKSVILISSDMTELLGLSDRVYVMNEGEIVGELSREELSQEKIMEIILVHSGRKNSK